MAECPIKKANVGGGGTRNNDVSLPYLADFGVYRSALSLRMLR